jgi:alpha-D-xyloside xylohydrolase
VVSKPLLNSFPKDLTPKGKIMRSKHTFISILTVFMLIICGYCSKAWAQKDHVDGPPPICPRWALEPWVWEDNGNSDSSLLRLVNQYEAHQIPVGAVIIDSPWEAGDGKISDLEIDDDDNKDDWSFRYNLQPSDRQYGDRNYSFTSIPESVMGAQWFRTANDSKTYIGDVIASFTLVTDATVYIAHDTRIAQKPDWLGDWQPIGSFIENDESVPTVYELFEKDFSRNDQVNLGPNTEDGSWNCGMYTVIVKTKGEDLTQYNTYEWNEDRYPEPASIIDDLHDRDIRVVLWVTGIINEGSAYYSDVEGNYCFPEANNCATERWWKSGGNPNSIHIDFRKPGARNWFANTISPLMEYDFDGFKCDRGADVFYDSTDYETNHLRNHYYNTLYQLIKEQKPEGIILGRAYSHQQQNPDGVGAPISASPINWQGDFCGNFDGLVEQMNDVYTSAEIGYSAPGVEVGGYFRSNDSNCSGGISTESLIRYAQFGAMTPLMLNGGIDERHEPWHEENGEAVIDIYRYYATLHSELVPYIFSYGVESHRTETSILRDTDRNRAQHKLGEEIFVSIVTDENESKHVVLPLGNRWIDYWNEANIYNGGETIVYDLPDEALERFPIFLRAGAIIPMKVRNNTTNHFFKEGEYYDLPDVGTYPDNVEPSEVQADITLSIYPEGQSEFLFHNPTGDGTLCSDIKIDVDETGGTIHVYEIPLDDRHVDDDTGAAICGETRAGYGFILRVKSFARPDYVTASGADAFKWFYRPEDNLIIVCVTGKDFTINISDLYGYGLVSNLEVNDTVNKDDWSNQYNLRVGDQQYGDRNYAFTTVPAIAVGAQWIRTANDSKRNSKDEVASFALGADATVYIAHDERVADKPDWLGDWVSIADFLKNDEQTPVRFDLFQKEFAMGDIVSLGPNTETGDASVGMYSVIIVPAAP